MSRLNRFAASLMSGYVLLGANMLYTLASVPLALTYLSKAEFGLWALVTQVAGYVALVDFGLSASASRVLIDHKDSRASGSYGSMVQTGALVGLTQGLLVMLVGCVVALFLGPALRVEPALQREFTVLLMGQCVLVGLGFVTRILNHMLTAHQRYDITNYTQASLFVVSFFVFWLCLAQGKGVISVLWAQGSGALFLVAANLYGCARLSFLPQRGEWGRPSWRAFRELFGFGRDFFLFALGNQLINASQVLLLTRFQGLETAAVWSICTRLFLLVSQVIYRVFDYSSGALAEMMVRGERARLQERFRDIVVISGSLSVAAGVALAVCNSAFVGWWTSGRINSLRFFPTDIKAPVELAAQLSSPTNAVSAWLWTQLPVTQRADVLRRAGDEAGVDQLQELLAAVLNRLVNGPSVYESNRFSAVALSIETQALLSAGAAGDVRQLNRHLLEDAFVGELANSRKAHWPPINDVLLGLWLVLGVSINAHTGLVGQTKQFAFMRFIPFLEGAAFLSLSILTLNVGGMTALLVASLACSAAVRLPYGFWRTRNYFALSGRELARWHRSMLPLALVLLPVGGLAWWLTRDLAALPRLCGSGGVLGLVAGYAWWRFGLPPGLRAEFVRRAPAWCRSLLKALGQHDSPRA